MPPGSRIRTPKCSAESDDERGMRSPVLDFVQVSTPNTKSIAVYKPKKGMTEEVPKKEVYFW
ncbi:Hypothetical protein SMAX5B_001493 [Scophthalmus maximus]|uniref:Uncharacterized protein n=1 Tax=Scophthalmus maximus TaxID=52904 RepID=A0A2U9B0V2_SCOMX|nr:Hypothetical protein SMAX5B_001493 [Scophthalmus maximus]